MIDGSITTSPGHPRTGRDATRNMLRATRRVPGLLTAPLRASLVDIDAFWRAAAVFRV